MTKDEHDSFRAEFREELGTRWTINQLKELIEATNTEREKRYQDKFESIEKAMAAGFAAAKEAVASALAAAKEAVNAAFSAAKEAITKQEIANEKRLEGINEFRGQLKDQQSTFITRDLFSALEQRVNDLEKGRSSDEGGVSTSHYSQQQSQWRTGLIVVGLIGVINLTIMLITLLLGK